MNPFEALNVQDDEEEFIQTQQVKKPPKKTHAERREAKEKKIKQAEQKNVNEAIPINVKQNVKARNYKDPKPKKGIPEGHTLDRRSGTGRIDRPRKEGGGKGNVGNVKDQLQKEKYQQKQKSEEVTVEQAEQPKPQEPQGMTLDQYYKNKGIEMNELHTKKQVQKKSDINAEWIKKEKLQLMDTKEQQKLKTRNNEFNSKREYVDKVGLADEVNSDILGFTTKPQKQEQERDNRGKEKKNKKEKGVVLKEEDFPTL